ncbi:MAG TPA: HIT family protein [Planctomycetota bacterium]|nr:HIT family protein [Planctomycetota bacterium]
MPSVFTRIIAGELPARFVWKDELCVAFLSANPLAPGHVLVVPRDEIDDWIDLPAPLLAHLMAASQAIGRALKQEFRPRKVGVALVGLEVPHVHVHLVPLQAIADLDFSRAEKDPAPAALDEACRRTRAALLRQGATAVPA